MNSLKKFTKTISLTITLKEWKYLRIHQGGEDLYNENYNILLKEIKQDINKWKHIPCAWSGTLITIKMSILIKTICRFNSVPIKIPTMSFAEREELIPEFTWRLKGTEQSKESWKRAKKLEEPLCNIKTNYRARVIKAVCWHKDRHRPME